MSKKKDKKQNALKHGIYSRQVMLPGEKIGDYEALLAAHYDEWVPDGVTEQYLVDDLCKLRWKKLRMEQYDQIRLQQRIDQIRMANDASKHRQNLKYLGAEFSKAASTEGAEKILSRLSPLYNETIAEWIPREKCTDPTQWGQEIGKCLSNLVSEDPLERPDLFAKIVNPDLIEIEISRSDRLDEAIDRKIKRLMQVKAAKQIFPNMRKNGRPEPKLINPPANADAPPALINGNEPKPVTHPEIIVSAKSDVEKRAVTAQKGMVIEGTGIDESSAASVPSAPIEKEHSGAMRAKVDFLRNQCPRRWKNWRNFALFATK
jgi:hypothetical protein